MLFSNYDDKTNVDDFYLLEDFFDTFLFLPQVKLQKNNPLRERYVSEQNDYDIDYSYEYKDKLPVKKIGTVLQTRGDTSATPLLITNLFTYY